MIMSCKLNEYSNFRLEPVYQRIWSLYRKFYTNAHNGTMSVHPGNDKMHNNLKMITEWNCGISKLVYKCLICQQVKDDTFRMVTVGDDTEMKMG
ncbi:RNA-directed DNA polymerase-like protein [Gossypium australe]|uniref:RNA-directed DNA polymerase-like protein n=1 Tax=Gossypium australe TaxID=47621 RepID=A0A5B6VM51_9ROSI|nr:RNA-directed DNA polymerase-like protein [Gossypium australe]